jgi:hypothetical protein
MILTGTLAYGQKCKYEYQKTDELSGKTSKAIIFELSSIVTLRVKEVDKNYFFDVIIFDIINGGSEMKQGDSLVLKLSTGEIISLYTDKSIRSNLHLDGFIPAIQFENALTLNQELLEKLSKIPIHFARVTINDRPYDDVLKEKDAKKLLDVFRCILQ